MQVTILINVRCPFRRDTAPVGRLCGDRFRNLSKRVQPERPVFAQPVRLQPPIYAGRLLGFFAALSAVYLWRCVVVAAWKLQRTPRSLSLRDRVGTLCKDSQIQTLAFGLISFVLTTVYFVDPFEAEGIWSRSTGGLLQLVASCFILLFCTAVVRIFADIVAKYHQGTKRVLTWLNGMRVALVVCEIIACALMSTDNFYYAASEFQEVMVCPSFGLLRYGCVVQN